MKHNYELRLAYKKETGKPISIKEIKVKDQDECDEICYSSIRENDFGLKEKDPALLEYLLWLEENMLQLLLVVRTNNINA